MFLEQDLLKMLLKQIQVILICMEYIHCTVNSTYYECFILFFKVNLCQAKLVIHLTVHSIMTLELSSLKMVAIDVDSAVVADAIHQLGLLVLLH